MKDYLKLIPITIVGGITALLLYPFFHEIGHTIASLIFGGEVKEIHVFPMAYVVCNVRNTKEFGKIMIGLSGMLFPFLISISMQPKKFWSWFTCFIFRGVCILSFLISLVAIVMFRFGQEIENEDIVQVMRIAPMYGWIYFVVMLALLGIDLVMIVKSRPLQQIIRYFKL